MILEKYRLEDWYLWSPPCSKLKVLVVYKSNTEVFRYSQRSKAINHLNE